MPTFSKSITTITYTPEDVKEIIRRDLFTEGYVVTCDQIEIQISGGYVDCDCHTWGGPPVGSCKCPVIPPKFNGYKIIYEG